MVNSFADLIAPLIILTSAHLMVFWIIHCEMRAYVDQDSLIQGLHVDPVMT